VQNIGPTALPVEAPPASTGRALAASVAGVVVVLLIANALAGRVLREYTANLGYALASKKWELLLDRSEPLEWLVLGDSTCNQGVDPRVLEKALGADVLNLCTVASGLALDSAWMLDVGIDRLGAPQGVLMIHSFHVWERSFEEHSLARVPLEWGFWERLGPGLDLDLPQQIAAFGHRSLPLYAEHLSLARMLREPWKTRAHFAVDDRGFMAEERPNPSSVDRDALRRLDALAKRPRFTPSSENLRALAHIGEVADREGFLVYLANPPLYRGLAESPEFRRRHAEVARMLNDAANQHSNVQWISGEFAFDQSALQSADHLVADAAKQYTDQLAQAIDRSRTARLARASATRPLGATAPGGL
jgi:hypothetical protein